MNFFDITRQSACAVKLPATTRDELIAEIARRAAQTSGAGKISETEIAAKLMEREQQGSTGFGGGIAIPHARLEQASEFIFFIVTTRKGIPFNALDGKKVQVFFVLLGPENRVRDHLKILATISNIVSHTNITRELLAARTPAALCETFLRQIPDDDQPQRQEKSKLLIVILYEDDCFYDILDYFIEVGLEGATIIDSVGMGQYISKLPLFASYIGFMNEQKNHSRTLLTTVPERRLPLIIRGIETITGDLERTQGAMVIALDIAFSKGSMQML